MSNMFNKKFKVGDIVKVITLETENNIGMITEEDNYFYEIADNKEKCVYQYGIYFFNSHEIKAWYKDWELEGFKLNLLDNFEKILDNRMWI